MGGSDALVRESEAMGLVGDHRSSQGDSLMDDSGGEAGLTGHLAWRGGGWAWLGPGPRASYIQGTHCDLVTHMAAKIKGGDHPVTAGSSGTSGLPCSSDCATS